MLHRRSRRLSRSSRHSLPRAIAFLSLLLLAVITSSDAFAQRPDQPDPDQPPPQAAGPSREQQAIVPDRVPLSGIVAALADDDLLSEEERLAIQLRHGLLERIPAERRNSAEFALASFDLLNPILVDEAQPVLPRAIAALERGEAQMVIDLLEGDESPTARLLVGRAHIAAGRFDRAIATLAPLRDMARPRTLSDAADITAAAQAVAELADLEGRPAADYHLVIDELSRAQQEVDRLYFPALIAQGALLVARDNPEEAVAALRTALTLNPTSSEAWYQLGRLAIDTFDFDSAQRAADKLRGIQPEHLYAYILEIESALTQKDTPAAAEKVAAALALYPQHRRLLAADAAVAALSYDERRLAAALERYDQAAGQNHLALLMSGTYLSFARQYDQSRDMLMAAIQRQPNDPLAYIELGLVLSQAGREDEALAILRRASELDPFNKRAANTLKLHEQLAGYQFIETEHFVVKYRDAIDGALAADMPGPLEDLYDDVTAAFSHEPGRKTFIEILPDQRWFAVRITGMPWIWTIGAATGPVIAITPPREGSYQAGSFDWPRVIRHEFTHTVTLDQTANRIPHWFTEACAVAQEPGPRDYDTSQLLAHSLKSGELFDLAEINWAFVRPKRPQDRALAYAQAHWMYQFITERFGHEAILRMLELASTGTNQRAIIPRATSMSEEEFLAAFHGWAGEQVSSWGLDPRPPLVEIVKEAMKGAAEEARGDAAEPMEAGADGDGPVQVDVEVDGDAAVEVVVEPDGDEPGDVEEGNEAEEEIDLSALAEEGLLDRLLAAHPDHPDLLRLAAERALASSIADPQSAWDALVRYAAARPVDPWADEQLADLALRLDRPRDAIPHLEHLDLLDQATGDHARRLIEVYRSLDMLDKAQHATHRALARLPYDAKLREVAATFALQRSDADTALRHLRALTLIEPDHAIHFTRLAALLSRVGRSEEANEAAVEARRLDPKAPVEPFLLDPNRERE